MESTALPLTWSKKKVDLVWRCSTDKCEKVTLKVLEVKTANNKQYIQFDSVAVRMLDLPS